MALGAAGGAGYFDGSRSERCRVIFQGSVAAFLFLSPVFCFQYPLKSVLQDDFSGHHCGYR
jgi:hypothetical protein